MIGRHGDDFDERNVFLHLALGVMSASRKLDRVLARHGRRMEGASEELPTREDDLLVHFVLGLISFRDSAVGALSTARRPLAASPAAGAGPRPSPDASPSPGGLLR